jgi:hypothetical protein
VGDVEDLEDPEDQRQAQRDDEQPRRVGDAVDEDGDGCVDLLFLERFFQGMRITGISRPQTRP